MTLRRDALAAVDAGRGSFRTAVSALLDDHGLAVGRPPTPVDHPADRSEREALLVDRVRALDDLPIGLTLTGPAYRDTPIVYVNRWFRERTGYALDELRGRNPRLFQGPAAGEAARADFREALSTWSEVTVELRNRRRDGTPFANRVSLRPLSGDAGTITHWIAAQEPRPIDARAGVEDGTPVE
ncbi:PAS domain-containing protein [Halorubrum sp. 2020YC2]|uniref:PAS domain-containing protein n=1 Tax=Halorubrum sp. 2020YC2 TaxID=2836432 RepID=UPI001BE9E379|nr:PAS domain-containing protein [Halorubrum sp. 2020YC2]QWC19877.1 PAS domain-containing protein [Halorubrum sp. 2020YC2]